LLESKKKNLNGSELFESIIPQKGEIVIKANSNSIHLKLNKSVGENANRIYSKGKKAEQKIKGTIEAIKNTKDKINKLEKSKSSVEERVLTLVKKRKRAWYEKFRWFVSSDGYLVIGGRDASSNESIFKNYINPEDIVFHTNYPGSPLAIIKSSDSKKVPESTLKETANFVASFSNAWKEDWGFIDVFYVSPTQISKTPPTGEYLPKGSFMINGKKNIIKDAKTELAIGLELIPSKDGSEKVVYNLKILCGPLSAISFKLDYFLTIKPSRSGNSKGKLAKVIKEKFINHFEEPIKKWIKLLNEDELILYLPAGKSKIVN
jgi:predicted ribosome quality control (RQC) complex YloA/Tae2 family protein